MPIYGFEHADSDDSSFYRFWRPRLSAPQFQLSRLGTCRTVWNALGRGNWRPAIRIQPHRRRAISTDRHSIANGFGSFGLCKLCHAAGSTKVLKSRDKLGSHDYNENRNLTCRDSWQRLLRGTSRTFSAGSLTTPPDT